jgi:hypothetical protein
MERQYRRRSADWWMCPSCAWAQPVTERGEMRDMVSVFDTLAWKLTRQIDPELQRYPGDLRGKASAGLRLDAFEQYIRGITEPDQQLSSLRHLNQSVQDQSQQFSPAWMALGREEYSQTRSTKQAAEAFAKVGRGNDPDALEARLLSRPFAAVLPATTPMPRRVFCRRGEDICRWPKC